MRIKPKIVFFGTPRIGEIALERLIAEGLKPEIVVTREDKPAGRGQKSTPPPVKIIAQKHKIEILQPQKLRDNETVHHKLLAIKPDLGIVAAYGRIIPKEVLDIPKNGTLNIHPSLLPKYRGASPVQTAILAGEKETGVTIILLDEELDHGPILAQKKIVIDAKDTQESLKEKLAEIGSDLLIQTISQYINGNLKPKNQNHKKATFTKMFKKEDGFVDFKNPPSPKKFDLMIRAFHPWPSAWARWQMANGRWLMVKFLPGNLIQPEGKKPMTINEFKNGYPETKEWIDKLYKA